MLYCAQTIKVDFQGDRDPVIEVLGTFRDKKTATDLLISKINKKSRYNGLYFNGIYLWMGVIYALIEIPEPI